jgi:hypothetical protein
MINSPVISRIRRRRRHADEPGWYEIAAAARVKLEDIPHGEGNARLTAIGSQFGRRPDTLRRFIAAATFIDRLKDDDLSPALKSLPVAAVELIARWWAYDPSEARKAAKLLAQGSYTIESLRAAEGQARRASKVTRWGRAGHHALRTRLGSQVKEMVQAEGEGAFVPDKPGRFDPRKLDFLFRSEGDANYRIAVLLFGPFQDEELYWTRKDDFLLNILGLSKVYTKVVGIIPTRQVSAEFEAWLDHIDDPNITFQYVDPKDATFYSPPLIHNRGMRRKI